MEVVEYIDVVGDDRLQAILDDPAVFNLRAIRAETLLDWVPDLGQYAAPASCRSQNGVFRTPGLANSDIPAILRHRFFIKDEADQVIGQRYIGLLIYDSQRDSCAFELSAGAEEIGVLQPWRHDNRRHLIVSTRPAQILGGHIPFTVRAIGKGLCYLESVLFMPALPPPAAFTPTIERLSARVSAREAGKVTAVVQFITQEAATVRAEARSDDDPDGPPVITSTTEPDRLHGVTLPELRAGGRYTITVSATERAGHRAQATLRLDTNEIQGRSEIPVTVPIQIIRLGDADPEGTPLTFGVPLAAAQLWHPGASLHAGNAAVGAQTRVHARWPDGSARWVLVDVPCPSLPTQGSTEAQVRLHPAPEPPGAGLTWQSSDERISIAGEQVRVTVVAGKAGSIAIDRRAAEGDWRRLTAFSSASLAGWLANDTAIAGSALESLALEEAGPRRAVVRCEVPVRDERGIEHLRSTFRLHVYADQPYVRVVHRLVVNSPALGPAFGSTDLRHLTPELEHVRHAVAAEQGEAASLLKLRSFALSLALSSECEHLRVVHEHDCAYRVYGDGEPRTVTGRHPGTLFLTLPADSGAESAAGLGLAIKDFWQTYPKGLGCQGQAVGVELFPALSGAAPPDYAEHGSKLYFWYDPSDPSYRLKTGMAFTTEFLLGWAVNEAEVAGWADRLEQPVTVRPAIEYLNATAALVPLAPKAGSPHPRYEAFMDAAYAGWVGQVEARHEYGFMNWGDAFSADEWFWSNNEYDGPFCHYMEFLRGGDPRWSLLGGQAARHLVDIDTCNYSRRAADIGAQYVHMPGHAGGFLPPFFQSKMSGSASLPSHSWIEGVVLHYLLSGDETARAVLMQTGLRLTKNLRAYDFTNARECGWHLIHLCGMARLSDDPDFLNAAALIVAQVLEKQEPGGGWEHPLSEGHCHCEPPRCHGEAGFMVGVLLSGLRRYYLMTGDARVAEAVVGGARWLIDKTYVPEAGLFRYTPCPTQSGPGVAFSVMVIEGLADACSFTADPRLVEIWRRTLDAVGLDGIGTTGKPRYSKNLLIEARYIPIMLHTLAELAER